MYREFENARTIGDSEPLRTPTPGGQPLGDRRVAVRLFVQIVKCEARAKGKVGAATQIDVHSEPSVEANDAPPDNGAGTAPAKRV
jgi:hypothetical protein